MADGSLRKCLQALRSAQSDNERFAALLMVTKVVRADECDDDTRREILDAMGFRFLTRLMKTTSVPDGCPTSIYKSVALSILSSFTQDPAVVSNPEIKKQITVLNEIILGDYSDDEGAENTEGMLSDCYDCIRGMLLFPISRGYLMDGGVQQALVEVIVSKRKGNNKAYEVLLDLLKQERSRVWEKQPSDAHKLLRYLVAEFKLKQDISKFEVGEILTIVLSTVEKKESEPPQSWVKDLVSDLNVIIRNKLDDKLRDCTLCLVSSLISSQGVTCVLPPYTEDLKLLLLVTHLACIEVRMILEDGRLEQIQKKSGVVCSCYGLLENLIGHMTTGMSMGLNEKQIVQLHSAMMGAFNSVIFFLSQVEQHQIEMATTSLLVTASVRVLGAWLAEETSALREEIYKLLPFLIQMCKQQNISCLEKSDQLPDLSTLNIGTEQNVKQTRVSDSEKLTAKERTNCESSLNSNGDEAVVQDSGPDTESANPVSGNQTIQNLDTVSSIDGDGVQDENQTYDNHGVETKCISSADDSVKHESAMDTDSPSSGGRENCDMQKAHGPNLSDATISKDGTKDKSNHGQSFNGDDDLSNMDTRTQESSEIKGKKTVHFNAACDNVSSEEILKEQEFRTDGVDLVKFLLPAMCHLTAEEKPREILLRENLHVLLVDYFEKQMEHYLHHRDDSDLRDTLASLCGIFLNLSVTEPAFVSTNHKFHQLLSSLLTYVPLTALDPNLLILTGNFVTLGLMMLRHQSERTDITSEKRDQFLAGSISFLSKAHSRVKRKPPMMAVSESYKEAWDDISELWFLSMQGLSALVPVLPDLSKLIMKSGWVPAVIRILLEVQGAGVDADSQSALLSMLTTLALNDTSAKRVIKEKRGIELAQMYLCEDLQNALTTS